VLHLDWAEVSGRSIDRLAMKLIQKHALGLLSPDEVYVQEDTH
jgi:hypothetical protein